VVGSFQDAIDSWKTRAQGGALDNDAVILAATAGAVNVNIGAAQADATDATAAVERPAPEMAHLQIIVGLVWRSVVMWVGLLGLLMLVRLLG
ncbi:MAG: cobalamin biosynthesis protein CbiB, partial [Hylemonella sp.]|nr:cobalamin biosynthesis protein CbiB [Hylemonella sp.]